MNEQIRYELNNEMFLLRWAFGEGDGQVLATDVLGIEHAVSLASNALRYKQESDFYPSRNVEILDSEGDRILRIW
jgi:hypothetical protein